jgi:hypothetical protein
MEGDFDAENCEDLDAFDADLCAMLDDVTDEEDLDADTVARVEPPADETARGGIEDNLRECEPRKEPPSAPPRPRRSLIDALAESRTGTSAKVAALLAEATKVAQAEEACGEADGGRPSIREQMSERYGTDAKSALERRERKARHALGGISTAGRKRRRASEKEDVGYGFMDARFAMMELRNVPWPQARHNARFEGATVMDISELPDDPMAAKAGRFGEFWVFGCLVRKHSKKRAKDGRRFSVWTISNMQTGSAADVAATAARKVAPGRRQTRFTTIRCLLFDGAFEAHHTAVEGDVFAFRKPGILPPQASRREMFGDAKAVANGRRDEWSGVCLKASRKDDVMAVGVCKEYGLCGHEVRDQGECGMWYNKKLGNECPKHAQQRLRRLERSTRMDVGNQERPGLARDDAVGMREPLNITKSCDVGYERKDSGISSKTLKMFRPSRAEREKTDHLRSLALAKSCKQPLSSSKVNADPRTVLKAASQRDREQASKRRSSLPKAPYVQGLSGLKGKETPLSSTGRAREKPAEDYKKAVATLLKLGFQLDDAGALQPPDRRTLHRLGIDLQKRAATTLRSRGARSNAAKDATVTQKSSDASLHLQFAQKPSSSRPPTDRATKISAGFADVQRAADSETAPSSKQALDKLLDGHDSIVGSLGTRVEMLPSASGLVESTGEASTRENDVVLSDDSDSY